MTWLQHNDGSPCPGTFCAWRQQPSHTVRERHAEPAGNPNGLSTNDYCSRMPVRQHSFDAKGKVLWLPRTGLTVVPYLMTESGHWDCVVIIGNGTYPRDGYSLCISPVEIATAIELSVGDKAQNAAAIHADAANRPR